MIAVTIYGYARVSSNSQKIDGYGLDLQKLQLKEAGATRIFEEVMTGTKMERPQWGKLMELLEPGDTLIVARLDRIARTAIEGCTAVRELVDKGVMVNVLNMGAVSDTPVGRMILSIMFAVAEFDRDMIVERLTAGREVARQREGYREGRPPIEIDEEAFAEAAEKVAAGELSKRAAAKSLGISDRTFRRRLKDVS